MHEIGIESSILEDIRNGRKTIEARLGKPKYLTIGVGDVLRLREDTWKDGVVTLSRPSDVSIKITQVLYFESFSEMLDALNYKAVVPAALNVEDAIEIYRQFYTAEAEEEFGVVAMLFESVQPTPVVGRRAPSD